jgi:chromosome segregation ATPase
MWNVDIENIGGIHSGTATVEPGINAVQASNWQGKTSLITALRVVLGGEITPTTLTTGQQEGHVRLTTEGSDGASTEYEVNLERSGNSIARTGTPFLTDPEDQICADLYAFLDERNEIRSAVRNGEDLTPRLTRPFEQMNIDEQIGQLKDERRKVESELERAEQAAETLLEKKEKLKTLESDIEELQAELDGLEGDQAESSQMEEVREELNTKKGKQTRLEQKVSNLKRKIEAKEEKLSTKRTELEELEVPDEPELEKELTDAQERLSNVEQQIETLESLYNVNTDILKNDHLQLVTDVNRQMNDDQLACWVCGEETTRSDVEAGLDTLSDEVEERRETAADLRDEVNELEQRRNNIRNSQQREQQLEREISELERRLDEDRSSLEETKTQVERLSEEIAELEDEVEETDDRRSSLEQSIAQKEADLSRVEDEIADLETEAERRDQLESQRNGLTDEIEDLRGRRERTITRVRESFSEALADVIEEFGPTFESARLEKRTDKETGRTTELELTLARDGREITVNELSEGEVELVGMIAALAGYEAFDVSERVPFLLLDDMGGLASEHLHRLVAYLTERADYVVTSAYPEAGEFDGHILSPDTWEVVSDGIEQQA